MSPSRLLTPRPSILPAIVPLCPSLDQLGEQQSTVASKGQRQAALHRRSQYNLGWVNNQLGGLGNSMRIAHSKNGGFLCDVRCSY